MTREQTREAAALAEAVHLGTCLLASLPRCDVCDALGIQRPATRAFRRGGARYCDEHGQKPDGMVIPEYPRAIAVRNLQKFLASPYLEQCRSTVEEGIVTVRCTRPVDHEGRHEHKLDENMVLW
jgi:hypothetical protein